MKAMSDLLRPRRTALLALSATLLPLGSTIFAAKVAVGVGVRGAREGSGAGIRAGKTAAAASLDAILTHPPPLSRPHLDPSFNSDDDDDDDDDNGYDDYYDDSDDDDDDENHDESHVDPIDQVMLDRARTKLIDIWREANGRRLGGGRVGRGQRRKLGLLSAAAAKGTASEETTDEKRDRLRRAYAARRRPGSRRTLRSTAAGDCGGAAPATGGLSDRSRATKEYGHDNDKEDEEDGDDKVDRIHRLDTGGFFPLSPSSSWSSSPHDDKRKRRRMQSGFAQGFILSALSPGFNPQTPQDSGVFYVAGLNVSQTNNVPNPKQSLVLRNFFDLFQPDPTNPNITVEEPAEIFWDVNIISTTERQFEAYLPNLADINFDWYMEVGRYRKNKKVRINTHNVQNPYQLWDFRPGPPDNLDSGSNTPLNRFQDRTWRPAYQLGQPELCVAPVQVNRTIQEFNRMTLAKCSNRNGRRQPQVWIYCFEGIICGTDTIDPPDLLISVNCEEVPTSTSLRCTSDNVREDLDNGLAISRDIWEDLTECSNDPNKDRKFGRSHVYRINDNAVTDWLALNLVYGGGSAGGSCRTRNDADAFLRVYEDNGRGAWRCVYVGRTDCNSNAGRNNIVAGIRPHSLDFLIVVSADGNATIDASTETFDLDLRCGPRPADTGNQNLIAGGDVDDLYCNARETLNVRDDSKALPANFDSLRTSCAFETDDVKEEQSAVLRNTWEIIDTRGIEADVVVESRCNNDGDRLDLQTLVRIYRIDYNSNRQVSRYTCVASAVLDCADNNIPSIGEDLIGENRYLVVATGGIGVEDCDPQDFSCR